MIGQSGGRSRKANIGDGARRRNTPRERQQIDPPWDKVVPRYRLTPRALAIREMIFVYGTVFGLGAFGGVLIAQWFRL